MTTATVRRVVIDWLDDNYHFGEAEQLIGSDDRSFLKSGILDSLGFVKLVLHLEDIFKIKIAIKELSPQNFDSLSLIARYVTSHRDYRAK